MQKFDFKIRNITIQSAKKKGVKHLRTIPISNRLYQAIGNIENDISIESNSFIFLQNCSRSYFEKTMWEALNLISNKTNIRCIRMPYGIRLQRTIFLQVHLWQK
jgi:hypothetical protein